ncbi:hypothetical protein, partial [Streptomyces chiangmaiensis]
MDEVRELLAEYGQWAADDTASVRDRARQLAGVVADLLRRTGPAAAVQVSQAGGVPAVLFDFEGRDYLVSCTVDESVVADGTIARIAGDAGLSGQPGDTRWALLSWTHDVRPLDQLTDGVRGFGVVLDRTLLDAAVAGLLPLADLIRDVFRRRQTHLPLAELAVSHAPRDVPLTMTAADRLTTPIHVPTQTWCGATSQVALVGEATAAQPSGMAWRARDSLLVTYEDGLVEVDPVRGRTRWFLTVDGCHGAPLIAPDGAVTVMAGPTVIRWHAGTLTAIAGGFEPGAELLSGPGGEPWVLSGSGVTYGAGEGTLALTRLGDTVGTQ